MTLSYLGGYVKCPITEKELVDKIKINALNYPSNNTNLTENTEFSNLKQSTKDKNHDMRGH